MECALGIRLPRRLHRVWLAAVESQSAHSKQKNSQAPEASWIDQLAITVGGVEENVYSSSGCISSMAFPGSQSSRRCGTRRSKARSMHICGGGLAGQYGRRTPLLLSAFHLLPPICTRSPSSALLSSGKIGRDLGGWLLSRQTSPRGNACVRSSTSR